MKTYAYVTSETCLHRDAVVPGAIVDDRPVSRHGDFEKWPYGKRETLQLSLGSHPAQRISPARSEFLRQSAIQVAALLRWWA